MLAAFGTAIRKEKVGFGGTAGVAACVICGVAEGKRYTTGASDFGMIEQALNNALTASTRQGRKVMVQTPLTCHGQADSRTDFHSAAA
jgi:hypothetical protein